MHNGLKNLIYTKTLLTLNMFNYKMYKFPNALVFEMEILREEYINS